MTTTNCGVYVQTTQPYRDLFLPDGDRWARADDRVYVYDDSGEQDGSTVAEADDEFVVSLSHATEASLADIPTTEDDSEVSP